MLLIVVLSVTDRHSSLAPPERLVPLVIFVAVVALSACFALQTGAAMNPARDFGPRLMTAIFYGREGESWKSCTYVRWLNLLPRLGSKSSRTASKQHQYSHPLG